MARELRLDQELACDAQVVAAHPAARRSYAEAMLKTQLAGRPLPLGCYWPAPAAHPLVERIACSSRGPGRRPPPGPHPGRDAGRHRLAPAAATGVSPTRMRRCSVAAPFAAAPPAPPLLAGGPAVAVRRHLEPPAVERISAAGAPSIPPRRTAEPLHPGGRRRRSTMRLARPAGLPAAWTLRAAPHPRRRRLVLRSSRASAVRVLATMKSIPTACALTTDLTSFGSAVPLSAWATSSAAAAATGLFTRVIQHGDRLQVTAGLNRTFEPAISGSIELGVRRDRDHPPARRPDRHRHPPCARRPRKRSPKAASRAADRRPVSRAQSPRRPRRSVPRRHFPPPGPLGPLCALT